MFFIEIDVKKSFINTFVNITPFNDVVGTSVPLHILHDLYLIHTNKNFN